MPAARFGLTPIDDNRWNKFFCGGCGNPKCYRCHGDRLLDKKKRDEIEIELDELDMEKE
jgi:hypothetical protein